MLKLSGLFKDVLISSEIHSKSTKKTNPQNKNVKVPNLLLFYYINYSDTFR